MNNNLLQFVRVNFVLNLFLIYPNEEIVLSISAFEIYNIFASLINFVVFSYNDSFSTKYFSISNLRGFKYSSDVDYY